jgi:Na+-transporting NADH:ubiquinone oxidoreductase subunit C
MLIAVCVAIFCSAMVSAAVFMLRPIQAAYAALERNQTILQLAGRLPTELTDQALVAAYLGLDARVVDLSDGTFNETIDGHVFDHWAQNNAAGDGTESDTQTDSMRYAPAYFVYGPNGLERIVLPVHGKGMWSTIYGYLALQPDLQTVAAVGFHSHGETPGIGDRIQDPDWLDSWQGKHLYDSAGQVRLQVTKDTSIAAEYRVDAISGATVTSEAVGQLIRFWMGPNGYQLMLQRLGQQPDDRES